jgi:aspartyl protease family protein
MLKWALRTVALYAVIGLSLAAGYGHGDRLLGFVDGTADGDASRLAAARERAANGGGWNEVVVEADPGGHFVLEAAVNGTPVRFLVDTGASAVVLAPDDARRVGFQPQSLDFSQRFNTANGVVRAAPVSLREVRLGQLAVYDLPASVNEAPLGVSLLGMTFLKRLRGYEVEDDRLVLRW